MANRYKRCRYCGSPIPNVETEKARPIRGKMLLIRILMGPRAGNVTSRGHFEVEHD